MQSKTIGLENICIARLQHVTEASGSLLAYAWKGLKRTDIVENLKFVINLLYISQGHCKPCHDSCNITMVKANSAILQFCWHCFASVSLTASRKIPEFIIIWACIADRIFCDCINIMSSSVHGKGMRNKRREKARSYF